MHLEKEGGRPPSGALEVELHPTSAPRPTGPGLTASAPGPQPGGRGPDPASPYPSGAALQGCWAPSDQDLGSFLAEQRSPAPLPRLFGSRCEEPCVTENTPLLGNSSQERGVRSLRIYHPEFITAEDVWDNSSAEWEGRSLLGSEAAGSSRSASSDKGDLLEGVPARLRLSKLRRCARWLKVTGLFAFVVTCSVSFSLYPDQGKFWQLLAVSPQESYCI